MTQTHNLLTGTLLAAILTMGLGAPAFAAKLSTTTPTVAAPGITRAVTTNIDFGDDASQWSKDGECDDPRFEGEGAATELLDEDKMHDATDCKAAFDDGTVTLVGGTSTDTANADIDFGDVSREWSKDGECDDPRFAGTGSAAETLEADILKDATDCKAAFDAGTVTLVEGSDVDVANTDIDFGDDSSEWSKDGECDDPRFAGTGSAAETLEADILKDATDCKAAFDAGTVTLVEGGEINVANTDIDFGDDSSEWNNDSECDDPRFEGSAMASEPTNTDLLKDATDCRTAFEAGTVTLKADAADILAQATAFDYGSDFSRWANDGECDDMRFVGDGMAKKLLSDDTKGDATDCRALVDAGSISIIPVYDPAYAAAGPYDSKGINFGDNTSSYADDGQCDDPRFQGPGTATTLLDGDLRHDRNDCKAAFEAGTVILL